MSKQRIMGLRELRGITQALADKNRVRALIASRKGGIGVGRTTGLLVP